MGLLPVTPKITYMTTGGYQQQAGPSLYRTFAINNVCETVLVCLGLGLGLRVMGWG